jgi:hypothetical protein
MLLETEHFRRLRHLSISNPFSGGRSNSVSASLSAAYSPNWSRELHRGCVRTDIEGSGVYEMKAVAVAGRVTNLGAPAQQCWINHSKFATKRPFTQLILNLQVCRRPQVRHTSVGVLNLTTGDGTIFLDYVLRVRP